MNQQFLEKLLDSDISRPVKEEILRYWLLPQTKLESYQEDKAPIQKVSDERVGAVRRPSKEELDLRNNPKKKEEQEEMENTLKGVVGDEVDN